MDKKTRITALAVLLALCAVSAPLWADDPAPALPAWEGKDNADKKQWTEMQDWIEQAWNTGDANLREEAKALPGKFSNQKDGVKYWKKEKTAYQIQLANVQAEKAREREHYEQVVSKFLPQMQKYWWESVMDLNISDYNKKEGMKDRAEGLTGTIRDGNLLYRAWEREPLGPEQLATQLAARNAPLTEKDFSVELTEDANGVIITGFWGKQVVVNIPAVIQGFPVRVIGKEAFKENENITSVVIPEGVTLIDEGAFAQKPREKTRRIVALY